VRQALRNVAAAAGPPVARQSSCTVSATRSSTAVVGVDIGWSQVSWGDVPTWIGSLVTSAAVVVAALTYRRSILDKEGAQAANVATWVGLRRGDDGVQHRLLLVRNGSDAPVYEVSVQLPSLPEPVWLEQVPATTLAEQDLPSADSWINAKIPFVNVPVHRHLRQDFVPGPQPELEFRDSAGRLWRRDRDGVLTRLRQRTVSRTTWINTAGAMSLPPPRMS
jgi:hypothetical protein